MNWKDIARPAAIFASTFAAVYGAAYFLWPDPDPASTVIVEDAITVDLTEEPYMRLAGSSGTLSIVGSQLRADTRVAICSHWDEGGCGFYKRGEGKPSPLASELLAINGVTAVVISHYRIVVRKAELFTWDELSSEIATVVEKVVAEGSAP